MKDGVAARSQEFGGVTGRRSAALLVALLCACGAADAQSPSRPDKTPAPAPPATPGAPANAPAKPAGSNECEERVKELEEQLAQAAQRIKDLNAQNERLRHQATDKGGGGKGTGGAGTEGPAAASPTNGAALASPHAMLDALTQDYQSKFKDRGRESKSEQTRLLVDVREWARDVGRSMRGPIDWAIQVERSSGAPGARAVDVRFFMLDGEGKVTGEPVSAPIPQRYARDLGPGARVRLVGTAAARPAVNPQRAEKGAASDAAFIGPYAEFGFELVVTSVTPLVKR